MALRKRGYIVMVVKTKCKNCKEFVGRGSCCNMCCSLKGKKKIFPQVITKLSIKKCIENNIGIYVDYNKIVVYSKELSGYINI